MANIEYDDVIDRIGKVYQSCSHAEQQMLLEILKEMSVSGESQTLEQLWLADFKEVPVSIDEFICNPMYLGNTNREGDAVYPFWRDTLRTIFNNGNRYNEIILSGATRIGKTSTAVIIGAYMLYRLMLYRNPHEYFKKKQVSKFYIAFANLTKELAAGVAYREFNDTLKESPWFNEHGRFSKSDRNFYYIPEGDKIDIIAGSDAAHMLGLQIWFCLTGDTKILTTDGYCTLEEACDAEKAILQLDDKGNLIECTAPIKLTKYVSNTIKITLEDGSTIEGTPEHLVMLSNGSYKMLGELTEDDDVLTFNISEVDQMNLKCYNNKFLVYVHTSPKGKKYVGITSKTCEERWQNGRGYRENKHFYNAITKYGWDNFTHEVVASQLSLEDACNLEQQLIAEFDTMNPDNGYNHTTGGNWSSPDEATRKRLSRSIKRIKSTPESRKRISEVLKGHRVSQETRKKISEAKKGRRTGKPAWNSGMGMDESFVAKLRGKQPWNTGLTKDIDERLTAMSEMSKNRPISDETKAKLSAIQKARYANGFCPVWITNGIIEKCIQEGEEIPEGFKRGRLNILDTYVNKDGQMKKISSNQVAEYLNAGWELGRGSTVGTAIRTKLQKYYWEYDNIRFDSAIDLAEYLNSHGYPKIVGSTVTALYNKGFSTSTHYSALDGKIRKVMLDENKED